MLRIGSRKQNLSDCLDVQPGRSGIESVGRSEAMRAWSALVQSRSFNSVVIEAEPPIRCHQVVGFGASVFVSPAFALDEITRPRPGLNARIIESIACGRPVILSEAELRSANTDGDLDLVILYGSFRAGILSPDETFEGYTLMASSFVESHVGYRINQMLNEVVDETEKYHNDLPKPAHASAGQVSSTILPH